MKHRRRPYRKPKPAAEGPAGVRVIARAWVDGKKAFEEEHTFTSRTDMQAMVDRHFELLSKHPVHMLEIELFDGKGESSKCRIGTDKSMMARPAPLEDVRAVLGRARKPEPGATTRVPGHNCPGCGQRVTAHSSADGRAKAPQPGDISLCFSCGYIAKIGDDLTMRELTDDDALAILADPDCVGDIARMVKTFQAMRAARAARNN